MSRLLVFNIPYVLCIIFLAEWVWNSNNTNLSVKLVIFLFFRKKILMMKWSQNARMTLNKTKPKLSQTKYEKCFWGFARNSNWILCVCVCVCVCVYVCVWLRLNTLLPPKKTQLFGKLVSFTLHRSKASLVNLFLLIFNTVTLFVKILKQVCIWIRCDFRWWFRCH